MAQGFIIVPTSEKVDTWILPSLAHREAAVIGGTADASLADTYLTDIVAAGSYGLAVREVRSGHTTFQRICTSGTNAVNVKATPGRLKSVHGWTTAATPIYIHIYDTAGTPTVGTDASVWTVPVQTGVANNVPVYRNMAAGIAISVLLDMTSSGTTPLAAGNQTMVSLQYY
jgi:hypothetical protein